MNDYELTVILAYHKPDGPAPAELPAQSVAREKIQLLTVFDGDIYHPRENALRKFPEALGRYTILLDDGDSFSASMLERLMRGLDGSEALFAMPAMTFQHIKRPVEYFSPPDVGDVQVDTSDYPTVFPIDLHGLLVRTDAVQEALAYAMPLPEPEKQAILFLLRRQSMFLYFGTCGLRYTYPKECDYQYDFRCMTRAWYYDPFEDFLLPLLAQEHQSPDRAGRFLQCLALHMIHVRIFANTDNRNKGVIRPDEVLSYCELFSRVLQYVDTAAILCLRCSTITCGVTNRLLDLQLKRRDFGYRLDFTRKDGRLLLTSDGQTFGDLSVLTLMVNLIDYRNGCLEIDGAVNDLFRESDAEIRAEFGQKTFAPVWNRRYSSIKCFGVSYCRLKTFHVSVPVPPSGEERILRFLIRVGGKDFLMEYAFPNHTSRFAKDFPQMLWHFGPYASFWNRDGIHVVKSTAALTLRREVQMWLRMWKVRKGHRRQIPLKVLNFLLRPYFSRQKIWLFFDKIYKGGDSSEYIYRYAAAQRDGIRKYYLLDPSSADYARMRREGFRPLRRGSILHRLVFLNADVVIASNSTVFAFNDYTFRGSFPFRGDIHFDVACVQHGMSVQKIALAQQRLRDNTKLYFCASKYEIENLSKPAYDYVGYNALRLTGVPRYDGLKDRARKIILLSPTWRMNSALPVYSNEGVARDYNPNFRETSYYKVYNSLINDPRLLDAARRHGYRIQYVLHPIVSPQYDDFTKNDSVEIISAIGDMSYEKLFCEAALMVTDFSGVQFDFAYMRKPVVYLHHDDIPQHYEEGTFHYTTMGFGEICHTNDELIDVLCRYMENGCAMPEFYRRRADDFFAFSDHENCARIYPILLEHQRTEHQKTKRRNAEG